MDYLYVLCIILMVLSCVLYMTLMVFIYVYYRLFACTNLVDVMSLFFIFFCSIYRFSTKIVWFLTKFPRKSPRRFLGKTVQFIGETSRISVFRIGMTIWVRVPDTCRVPDPTGMDTGVIFYPWMTSVPDSNRDGYGTGIFSHSRVTRRVPDTLLPL
jgi:hypothetical protein